MTETAKRPVPSPPPGGRRLAVVPPRTVVPVHPDDTLVTYWNHPCPECSVWVPNHRRACAAHEVQS